MPEKAAALNVPRGPAYARLVKGEEVESTDGKTVRPEQVLGPGVPGPLVIVADCPTVAHIPSLKASITRSGRAPSADSPHSDSNSDAAGTVCVIHLSPHQVVAEEAYQGWMDSFGSSATHIVACECSGETVMLSAARLQATLNTIDARAFPMHVPTSTGGPTDLPPNQVAGRNLLKFHLRPASRIGIDATEVPKALQFSDIAEAVKSDPEVWQVLEQASKACAAHQLEHAPPASIANIPRDECEITLLGTGSSMPSKYRNVTGIHVNLFQRGGMMLDCGEDTYGQMVRRFGFDAAREAVAKLKLIWISHIHADHHVGLARLLRVRQAILGRSCEPIVLVGPKPLRQVLVSLGRLEALSYMWVDGINLVPPHKLPEWHVADEEGVAAVRQSLEDLGLATMHNVRAVHCAHAWGVVFQSKRGWKVVFSGDTRPCPDMVEAAKGVDLLIHEATFDDDMAAEALAKRHSMTSEAVGVGAEAGAYRTLLTHFSQRYPKIPVIAPSFQDSTCIAFDMMSVNLADVARLPALVPVMQHIFKDVTE
mmetsp:Transcript_3023/g.7548  ORF Transcript_3023/g.7548 Transcript_3023/m.7548 type:complete len:538 (-) Transcript_3023:299-1912(-)